MTTLEAEKARERIALPRSVVQRVVLVMASLLIAAIAVGFTTTRWMIDPKACYQTGAQG